MRGMAARRAALVAVMLAGVLVCGGSDVDERGSTTDGRHALPLDRALRAMQDRVTKDLECLEQQNLPDDASKLTPYQRARLERLAHQQGTIRTMWRDFAKNLGLGEELFDAPPEESPEGGEEER